MKLAAIIGAGTLAFLGAWTLLFELFTWAGFSDQATRQYGFTSGVGPMLLTALTMSTLFTGMWRHVNCHVDKCAGIARHQVAGGEYKVCGKHWRQVNDHPADHKYTVAQIAGHHKARSEAKP